MRTETVESLYAQLAPNVKGYIKAFRIKCKDTIDELHQEARLVIWRVLTQYPEYTGIHLLKTCSLAIINRYKDLHRMEVRYRERVTQNELPIGPRAGTYKTTPYDVNSARDVLEVLLTRVNADQMKRETGTRTKSTVQDTDIIYKLLENGGRVVAAARELGISEANITHKLKRIRARATELLTG